jgi:hypothetical protein
LSKQLGWNGGQLVVRQVPVVGIHNVKGARFIIPDKSNLIGHKKWWDEETYARREQTSHAIFIYLYLKEDTYSSCSRLRVQNDFGCSSIS